MNTFYRLQSVFRNVFNDPTLRISSDLAAGAYEDWDSVATVHIVLATEVEFGVRFTTDEVGGIRSVADIVRLLESYAQRRDGGAILAAARPTPAAAQAYEG
ncbi:acyl carrier protein [Oscillochloris sp. ZM17-4]|uniref:acyl carrier protein n=1 Tax=Oscillochloris sp. ZM17-4 TaxID=2866714 RepID=UPI001C738567|nr:acyl carrier protein [Oscillochloris sp. ZM17-4]MBX0331341.1 acyl carrier protein [Oscillochloris sp. ZM17-4]